MLTLQKSDFENLDPAQVLGAFMVENKIKQSPRKRQSLGIQTEYVTKIRFLQGSPKNYHDNIDREYSETGSAITDFVTGDKSNEDDILAHVDKSAIPFYRQRGFELCPNPSAPDMMIYHHKKRNHNK